MHYSFCGPTAACLAATVAAALWRCGHTVTAVHQRGQGRCGLRLPRPAMRCLRALETVPADNMSLTYFMLPAASCMRHGIPSSSVLIVKCAGRNGGADESREVAAAQRASSACSTVPSRLEGVSRLLLTKSWQENDL